MKKNNPILTICILLFPTFFCFAQNVQNGLPSGELKEEIVEIELEYYAWSCPCAKWITPKNKKIFEKQTTENNYYDPGLFYYIIPVSDSIPDPFDLTDDLESIFKFKGRFFKEKQFMNFEGEEEPAITFQYDHVTVVKK